MALKKCGKNDPFPAKKKNVFGTFEFSKENDIFLDDTWHGYLCGNIDTHFLRTYRYFFEQIKFKNLE